MAIGIAVGLCAMLTLLPALLVIFACLCDLAVVLLPCAPQQRLIGRVLDQSMLEAVDRLRR